MTAATDRPPGAPDLLSIQCLRGIAALMIVFYHCVPQLQRMGYAGSEFLPLSAGVDVFFIISGFIMYFATARSPHRGPAAFLWHRAIRILPLYWLLTFAVALLAIFVPQAMQSSRFELDHVVKSVLMIAALHPVQHEWRPLIIPGWSLNYEMFFYLVFSLGIWLARGRMDRLFAFVVSVILAIAAIPLLMPIEGVARFYTDPIILEFVFGMAIGRLFVGGWRIGAKAGAALVMVGAIGMACWTLLPPWPRPFSLGLSCLCLFVGVLYLPLSGSSRILRAMRILGDASYSLYLTHWIVLSALGQIWRRLGLADLPGRDPVFVISSALICVIAALIVYYAIERPMTDWLKRSRERSSSSIPSHGAGAGT